MKKYIKYFLYTAAITATVIQVIPIYEVEARPGGGSSYRSGGSRSSGGYRSSGGSYRRSSSSGGYRSSGGVYTGSTGLFDLIITIMIIIFIVSLILKFKGALNKQTSMAFTISGDTYERVKVRNDQIHEKIEQLKQSDPDFSKVLFLDFVNSLYNKFYTYLNENKINTLKPFISESIINDARMSYKGKINEVVIGSINIVLMTSDEINDYITVDIDANYTLWRESKKGTRYLVIERWKFFRKKGTLSKAPEVMRGVSCPNCAGPTDFTDSGECNYCKTYINKGDMQWAVQSRMEINKEQFTVSFGGTNQQEEGNELSTIVNDNLEYYLGYYLKRNNIANMEDFWSSFKENVVKVYFKNIYKAWSENHLIEVRGLLSDRLYESFNFWIYSYKQDGFVNKLENIKIHNIDMADIDLDKYYDSITVRIFASCYDYIQDTNGKVVSGSKSFERRFTEYWTFIKRSGLKVDETKVDITKCPNCSAPADNIGQAGKCEYCGSKISTGDFSWVLTIITQDEVYKGT